MYQPSPGAGALRQGEILSNVSEYRVSLPALEARQDPVEVENRRHPYAIILTQDCDLDWDYDAQRRIEDADKESSTRKTKADLKAKLEAIAKLEARRLPTILLCEVHTATTLRGRKDINAGIWKQIAGNKHERYHFFQSIPQEADLADGGLPELAIDFKRYFTVPVDELYWQLASNNAQRRTCLASPYLEHLSHRFVSFLARVALPEDYESMPEG